MRDVHCQRADWTSESREDLEVHGFRQGLESLAGFGLQAAVVAGRELERSDERREFESGGHAVEPDAVVLLAEHGNGRHAFDVQLPRLFRVGGEVPDLQLYFVGRQCGHFLSHVAILTAEPAVRFLREYSQPDRVGQGLQTGPGLGLYLLVQHHSSTPA